MRMKWSLFVWNKDASNLLESENASEYIHTYSDMLSDSVDV